MKNGKSVVSSALFVLGLLPAAIGAQMMRHYEAREDETETKMAPTAEAAGQALRSTAPIPMDGRSPGGQGAQAERAASPGFSAATSSATAAAVADMPDNCEVREVDWNAGDSATVEPRVQAAGVMHAYAIPKEKIRMHRFRGDGLAWNMRVLAPRCTGTMSFSDRPCRFPAGGCSRGTSAAYRSVHVRPPDPKCAGFAELTPQEKKALSPQKMTEYALLRDYCGFCVLPAESLEGHYFMNFRIDLMPKGKEECRYFLLYSAPDGA